MSTSKPSSIAAGEAVFRVLVDTVEDYAIFTIDPTGIVIYWNRGAMLTLGYQQEDILGKPFDVIFTEQDRAARVPQQEMQVALQHGRSEDERWQVRSDGTRFWALGILVSIRNEHGTLLGFGKILRDRTDLKMYQDELRNRATDFAKTDEDKNVFIATLAHELRNPLASIAYGTTVLKRIQAPQPVAEIAAMIERQVSHSKRLIEDLLDIARIGRDKLKLSRAPADLRDILKQAAEMMKGRMASDQLVFHLALPDRPLIIACDQNRIVQIVVNLLSNAIKFTELGGTVTLNATAEGEEAVIRVADTGIGIPPDKLATIFDLFSQATSATTGSQAGLGIGLALTRDLVALHGGTIQVRSEGLGRGSEFVVRLPLLEGAQKIQ